MTTWTDLVGWLNARFGRGDYRPWEQQTRPVAAVWPSAQALTAAQQAAAAERLVARGWDWDSDAVRSGRFTGQRVSAGPGDAMALRASARSTFDAQLTAAAATTAPAVV